MVLAMVGDGTNSGYAMRRQMQGMRGGRWSAESGSVYRVLRRLQGSQLVNPVRKVGVPNRERTEYELTPAGQVLVSKWLSDAPAQQDLEYLLDALRTRTYFLKSLEPKKRAQTVKNWMVQNKKLIAQLQAEDQAKMSAPQTWVHDNLTCLAKARQDWLKKLYADVREGAATAKTTN
jgi:DNA-binding PadR family transcriptional regulator